MAARKHEQIVTHLFEVLPEVADRGSLDLLDDLMAPDVKVHGTTGEFSDLRSFKESIGQQAQSMGRSKVKVLSLVSDRDEVSVVFDHSVTFASDFQGVAAAGKSAQFTGTGHFRIRDGKVAEAWIHEDIPAMTAQIAE